MKITIVLGAFFPVPPIMGGAVEKVWFALGQEFARRGHEVVQVSRAHPSLPKTERIAGVTHLRVPGFDQPRSVVWLKLLDLIYSLRLHRVLPKADILVTNTFWLPMIERMRRHGLVCVQVQRGPKGQMRWYSGAARLHAVSHAIADVIFAQAPELRAKVRVIPNPVPFRAKNSSDMPRSNTILFVGRIHPEKGVHLLVEAFAEGARTVFADWKLMIVGSAEKKFGGGGEAYLASLRRSASDDVTFADAVFEARHLEQHFRAARLFIYPSLAERGESFGLAPLEAMAHGCAVLVSDLSCFHDFIRDGDTGFIFNHRAKKPVDTLREKIENVIVDQTLLARVAEAGYRKSAEYSLTRVADQFLADFDSVIRNSNA